MWEHIAPAVMDVRDLHQPSAEHFVMMLSTSHQINLFQELEELRARNESFPRSISWDAESARLAKFATYCACSTANKQLRLEMPSKVTSL